MGGLGSCRTLLGLGSALVALWAGAAGAGPNGPTVVGGQATVAGAGTSAVTVNQSSQNAIINWATFNIGRGETTTFNQPNSSSVALNRVIGGQGPSFLDGTLTANGRVFIVNGDGILFGAHSSINTAGFLATTNNISNSDFMAGRHNFNLPGRPDASIVNLGIITATSGGFAALVAPGVRNSGTVTATLGTVSLAAGNAFTLDFYGDRLITLAVNDQIAGAVKDVQTGAALKSLVSNTGKLSANGGRVELTAAAARAVVDSVINNTGVIEANSIGTKNGMIVLAAATAKSKPAGAPTQTVKLAGKISAAGKDKGTKGGTVVVTGENIVLAGASIDASGDDGGGHVLIGGDTGGGQPSAAAAKIELAKLESFVIPTATTVSVDAGTVINGSATGNGNGGKVVLWSDQQTTFTGTILAQGGASGGNGGLVETSSQGVLQSAGTVDLRAPMGNLGTLLLDPADFYINSDGSGVPAGASVMTQSQVEAQLALSNLTIATSNSAVHSGQSGNIFLNAGVTWATNSALELRAANDIHINAAINAPNGALTLNAGHAVGATAAVNVATFTLQNGAWVQETANLPSFSAQDFRIVGGSFLRVLGGDGSSGSPYQIADVYGLQGIGSNATLLAENYVLASNIDASGTVTWNAGSGFAPIGTSSAPFTGRFNGQGNTISNLFINRPTTTSAGDTTGLFGYVGSVGVIQNIGLTGGGVTGENDVAALVGTNYGSIQNSYATGPVIGWSDVGGLVGYNAGVVSGSHAAGAVTGSSNFGGVVGLNSGSVTLSYWGAATGRSVGTKSVVVSHDDCECECDCSTTLTITANNQSKVYGTALNLGTTAFTITHTGILPGDFTVTSVTLTSAGAAATANVAGSPYSIVPSNAHETGIEGFITPTYVAGLLTVTPAPLTITANDQSKVYGTALNLGSTAFTTTGGLFNGDTVSSVTLTSAGAAANASVRGGPYAIVPGNAQGTGLANYTIAYVDGSLTVIPAALTVTAKNQSKVYGTALDLGTTAFTTTGGLFNGDTVKSVTLKSAGAGANASVEGSPYTIVPSNAQGTGLANYTITYVDGSLTVTPATLTITANSQSKVYGTALDLGTTAFTTTAPSLSDVSITSVTLTSIGAAAAANVAGAPYAIVASNAQGTGLNNYTIDYVNGWLAVTPAPLTVAANNQSKVYGTALDLGTTAFTTTGKLFNGDSINAVTLTSAGATAAASVTGGPYSIVASNAQGSGLGNYAISYVNGSLAVTPAPLTVTAHAQNINIGAPIPILTSGVAGLVNGDTLTGALATTATFTSPGGQYPITLGTLGNPNYAITYFGAALTIVPPPATPIVPPPSTTIVPPPSTTIVPPPSTLTLNTQLQQRFDPPVLLASLTPAVVTILPPPPGAGPVLIPQFTGLPRLISVPPPRETRFVSNEVLLQVDCDTPQTTLDRMAREMRLTILSSICLTQTHMNLLRLHINSGQTVAQVIRALARYQVVAVAQANFIYTLMQDQQQLAQDPDLAGRSPDEGDAAQYSLGKLGLIDLHRQIKGTNVPVAVIDSQIDIHHPDLDGVFADQYDAVGGAAEMPHPHGTGMAGAIAAHRRLMGIAPAARLYAIHAFSSKAASAESTTFNILKSLDWAADKGVRVINMSFAGPRDPSIERALKAAHDKGIVLIAAAGNAGPKSPPLYPGADPNVIAVTATDVNDKIFSGANRGRYIGVAAPGVDILVPAPDSTYQLTTGTSVSSAEVSGIAALLLERNPKLTPEDIRKILTTSAKHPGNKERDDDVGAGLVDPPKAVQQAGQMKPVGQPARR
jgi:filamentous hemagglutinin family protein